jgi:hypothetical protein
MIKKIYKGFCNLKVWKKFMLLFVIFFPFRFLFGIFSEFWFEDELQIYLIGLKFYSNGHWPFFGPDVVYTFSQIPGALQGLLVGLPFYIFPIPEAPYILLNLITFISLFFFALYIIRCRTTEIPEWFLWIWIFTAPWVLSFSTHILNPSYVLPAAILFFISFMEIIPVFRKNIIAYHWAFFFMGFSMLWIFQLHMSWILLLPFIGFAFLTVRKNSLKKLFLFAVAFLVGCLVSGILVIPTFLKYGIASGSGDTASNIVFNISNIKEFFTVLTRLLSFGSFELARLMGNNTVTRLDYLSEYIWLSPFIIFAGIVGVAQVAWMIISWFLKKPFAEWEAIKYFILAAFLITWLSFFFSVKGPSSHTFYLMFPVVMIYSFYCWQPLFKKRWIRILAAAFLISATIFQITLMDHNYRNKSMYINREKPANAILQKNFHLLGERRGFDHNE